MKVDTKTKREMKKLVREGKTKLETAKHLGLPYHVVCNNTPAKWRHKNNRKKVVVASSKVVKPVDSFKLLVKGIMACSTSDTNKLLAIDLLL